MINYLKNFTLTDAIKIEYQDRQFLALKKLYEEKQFSDELYLFLIIANALISFQLSGKGEDYWEEFSFEVRRGLRGQKRDEAVENDKWKGIAEDGFRRLSEDKLVKSRKWKVESGKFKVEREKIYSFFEDLLKNGKNNRRFVDLKLGRLQKILSDDYQKIIGKDFFDSNLRDWEKYYQNMTKLAQDLAKVMNQKKDDKTIVFAVKMFSYGARNVFGYIEYFPFDLVIPLDSRLTKLYEIQFGKGTKKQIQNYYLDLAKKLNIPPLHLDAILWVNYDKLIK